MHAVNISNIEFFAVQNSEPITEFCLKKIPVDGFCGFYWTLIAMSRKIDNT